MASNADKEYHLRITGDSRDLGEATKRAATNLNAVKQEAIGLASALSGGLIGGGLAGIVGFAVNKIGEKIRETRDLMRDAERLDVSPESARFTADQERLLGTKGVINAATEAARQQRSEALAGSPVAAKAFESIGVSLQKIRDLKPDDLFMEIVQAFPSNPSVAQRDAFRRIVGERAGAELEGFAAGGFFRSNEAIQAAKLGGIMEMVTRYNIGELGVEFQDSPAAVQTRKRFKEDLEPLPQFSRDQGAEARRMANAETYNQLIREQLPLQQKIAEIRADIVKSDAKIMSMAEGPLRQQEISRQASRFAALNQLQTGASGGGTAAPGSVPEAIPSDSFTRVGRYVLGAGDPSVNIGRESLQTLRSLKTLLEKLPAETGRELAANL